MKLPARGPRLPEWFAIAVQAVFICMMLVICARCAHADPVPPTCFPGADEPKVERFFPYIVTNEAGNCAAVWFCDGGHHWVQYSIVGSRNDSDNCSRLTAATATVLLFANDAYKRQLYTDSFIGVHAATGDDLTRILAEDAPALALARTVPTPTTIPPSGLVTTGTVVYTVSSSENFNVISPVGKIALGVICDTTQTVSAGSSRYFVVPRAAVVWTGSPRLRVYGKCD